MQKRTLLSLLFSILFIGSAVGQSVIINEINYNSAAEADTEDWIELFNNSDADVDISGWIIKDSNDDNSFIFDASTILPAGGYIVAVRDLDDFQLLFPNVTNVVDSIDFNFANAGELVRLYNASDEIVDQVEYDDESPWPTEPDGSGPTLELIDPQSDNSLAASWGSSSGNGTPGEQNSITTNNEEENDDRISFRLEQNYPNPFNPSTNISYSISEAGAVTLEVFDLLGQKVATLVNRVHTAGIYNVDFDASNLTSGIYIYRINQDGESVTRRMTLIK